jgi:DNA-directed RNA polymerase specialized sigma24 family protein
MAIAKNRHLKELRTDGPSVLVDIDGKAICGEPVDVDVTEKERKMQAIDDELAKLSNHCREILTLFYVKRMSLEQIMMSRSENTSKDGLKTSKSKCLRQLKTNVVRCMSYE